ncbi:MAG: methyltransferase domain-containing protein [Planctomycetes bacterium]|nr:methyltransferase domain-containing protein [Planctomycetota bacterium]
MAADAGARIPRSPQEVLAHLEQFQLNAEERSYAATHSRRFVRALAAVDSCLRMRPESQRILDVAPHLLSDLLADSFAQRVNTVGAPWRARSPKLREGEHLDFDLNTAHTQAGWEGFERHDIVMMGEILEHLHASPRMVLGCVRRWIAPGGFLVLQTPNAARLWTRLTLLRGINPFEMPRDGMDPGHFHEFTLQELLDLAAFHALEPVSITCEDDFTPQDVPRWRLLLRRAAARPSKLLRESFTLVLRKPLNAVDPVLRSRRLGLHIDRHELTGDALRVGGWAADLRASVPARALTLHVSGVDVPCTLESVSREDVATNFQKPALAEAGFILSARVPRGFQATHALVRCTDRFGDTMEQPLL